MFADESEIAAPVTESSLPTSATSVAVAENSNSNVTSTAESNSIGNATATATATAETDPSSTRSTESRASRSAPTGTTKPSRAKPDEIIVDGETVYMGDTKITPDGTIETPDHIIDENGVTPRRPMPPRTRPVVIPPIDMRYMTPQQRRKLQEALRRHRVTMAPSPTPEN
jgi:hypothetical protein